MKHTEAAMQYKFDKIQGTRMKLACTFSLILQGKEEDSVALTEAAGVLDLDRRLHKFCKNEPVRLTWNNLMKFLIQVHD